MPPPTTLTSIAGSYFGNFKRKVGGKLTAADGSQFLYHYTDPSCLNQPNYVLSCFPDSNTTLIQGTWSKFVFNSRFPTFIGAG